MKKYKRVINDIAEKYRGSALPRCPYFGECGGCLFQDISYENQLLLKKEYLSNLFQQISPVERVNPSPVREYRARMDFVCAFDRKGLRRRGSHRIVVDIEQCAIMQNRSNNVWQKARTALAGVADYNYLKHEGLLRYIVLRQAMQSGEMMLNLVSSSRDIESLTPAIDAILPHVDSLSVLLSDTLSDVSFGEVIADVKRGYIEEHFGDICFEIKPNSFFQSNSAVAQEMYSHIKEKVSGRVLDLYSGVGSISLYVASQCEHITGVEVVREAVDSANINKEKNNIANADFICADVADFMHENTGRFDTIILDPPRNGMHPKVAKAVRECAPEKIVYMSCNPRNI